MGGLLGIGLDEGYQLVAVSEPTTGHLPGVRKEIRNGMAETWQNA